MEAIGISVLVDVDGVTRRHGSSDSMVSQSRDQRVEAGCGDGERHREFRIYGQ